jgi:lipopolysaccharide export system permease protein
MLGSGMSFRRFLRPYIICALFSAGLILYANHWLVPVANKTRITFEDKYVRPPKSYGNDIHMRLDEHTFIALNRFKYNTGEGNNFSLEIYKGEGENRRLTYKINADRIQHIPGVNNWRLIQYRKWNINGLDEEFVKGRQMDTLLNMEPEDFEVNTIIKEALNYREIHAFISEEELRGAGGLEFYEVESHRRTASAISVIIMIVIGAIMGSQKVRGGMGLNIVAAIAMGAMYVVFLQFSSSFSVNGSLPPILGANVPNIIYGVVAIVLFRRFNK